MHQAMAATLDTVIEQIKQIQRDARSKVSTDRPLWPMIVLKSPKGLDGSQGCRRLAGRGNIPFASGAADGPANESGASRAAARVAEELQARGAFRRGGKHSAELAELAPTGDRRMGANPHANGGLLLHDLRMPDFREYAVQVPSPGGVEAEDTAVLGKFVRDVIRLNQDQRNFRVFGPDETMSNRLTAVFEATNRQWDAETVATDQYLAPEGRVMEVLSEHQCEGWLEGYLLTGRHGLFNCYEAFIHIVDSMFNQHAKWLKSHGRPAVAPQDRLAELSAGFACVAAGPQRIYASGSGLYRSRREQEGGDRSRLSAARCQLPVVGDGPLPAQPALCERGDRRKTSGSAMVVDGCGGEPLHGRHRHLGMGQQRSGRRAGCRDGLRRRRADARNAGGRFDAAPIASPI